MNHKAAWKDAFRAWRMLAEEGVEFASSDRQVQRALDGLAKVDPMAGCDPNRILNISVWRKTDRNRPQYFNCRYTMQPIVTDEGF